MTKTIALALFVVTACSVSAPPVDRRPTRDAATQAAEAWCHVQVDDCGLMHTTADACAAGLAASYCRYHDCDVVYPSWSELNSCTDAATSTPDCAAPRCLY